jgi:uncharacterized protein
MARFYRKKWLYVRLPIALAAVVAATLIWVLAFPLAPTQLTISTAGQGGAYYRIAERYAERFAAHGVTLNIKSSAGSGQNLERLNSADQPVDLALMQGGMGYLGALAGSKERSRVETLANVDVEAIWLFSKGFAIESLSQLTGLTVAVDSDGSGSRKVALMLFDQARLSSKDVTLSPVSGLAAVEALASGKVDAVLMVSPSNSRTVLAMLQVQGIQIGSLRRAAAIVERNPYLEQTLLTQGALDTRFPSRDISVLTTPASLVARQALHPSLKRLATSVAADVHTPGGTFHRPGDFPALRRIDFPVAAQARSTLSKGLPFHEQWLPFRWAQIAERLVLIVLPISLLALWLMRVLPGYLRWALESRVNRWYGELKFIENDLGSETSGIDLTRFLQRLNAIDKALLAFSCPKDLMARCFMLHQHIEFVRQRLYKMRGR